jgi:hypothetical protein
MKKTLTTLLAAATVLSGCAGYHSTEQTAQVTFSTHVDPRTPDGQWNRLKAEFNYWETFADAHPNAVTINKVISICREIIAYSSGANLKSWPCGDNCRDDGTDLGTRSVQGTAF